VIPTAKTIENAILFPFFVYDADYSKFHTSNSTKKHIYLQIYNELPQNYTFIYIIHCCEATMLNCNVIFFLKV